MEYIRHKLRSIDTFTAVTYCFVHFACEVLCFYIISDIFPDYASLRWSSMLLYDVIAFATQPIIGTYFEGHPDLSPGLYGIFLLIFGALGSLIFADIHWISVVGIIVFALGNAVIHIAGAMSTARVSEGRLSESAVFVGGGSYGVITGKLLAADSVHPFFAFVPVLIAVPFMLAADRRIRCRYNDKAFNFKKYPLEHSIAASKPTGRIVLILGLIVMARGYIGYGLPTAWIKLSIHTILLYVFMGLGKILGGLLSDLFGATRIGVISCFLALPLILIGNNIIWLSLLGIMLFSMTMAVTLGGLFSVMRYNPGTAFGVTTIGLLLGSLPLFFIPMPSQSVCNILNIFLSIFAVWGILYCISENNVGDNKDNKDKLPA